MTKKENEEITCKDCEISIPCHLCPYFDECANSMEDNND